MILRLMELDTLYDLSDGSLSTEPIGRLDSGEYVYSAEALLNDLGCFDPNRVVNIFITSHQPWEVKECD